MDLDEYTFSLELEIIEEAGDPLSIYAGTGRLQWSPDGGESFITFEIPDGVWGQSARARHAYLEATKARFMVIRRRRSEGRVECARLYQGRAVSIPDISTGVLPVDDDEIEFELNETPLCLDNATVHSPEADISPMWKLNPSAGVDGPSTMTGRFRWFVAGFIDMPLDDMKLCLEHLVDWFPLA